jgi:hypothetical protein
MLVAALALAFAGCRTDAGPEPRAPMTTDAEPVESAPPRPDPEGPPPRWAIDGTTVAADPRLPLALERALREHGRLADEVQDHILVDLNDDGRLDAVLLLPTAAVAGAYDLLVLLSVGESIRVHPTAELIPGASFAAAVLPLVDGPTLVAVAPRLGGCERGPQWSFLRVTGDLLEPVGSVRVDDYDCATVEASIEFVRAADGSVSAVELRRGEALTVYRWDGGVGSFAVAE